MEVHRRELVAGCFALSACAFAPKTAPPPPPPESDPWKTVKDLASDIPPVSAEEHAAHLEKMQVQLRKAHADVLIVEPGATMRYLSGVSWWPSERAFLAIVPAGGEISWIVPAFEETRARELCGASAKMRLWQEHEDPYALLAAGMPGSGSIAIDPSMREMVASGVRRAAGLRSVVSGADVIRGARMIKTDLELMRLERASEITKKCLALVAQNVHGGMTESALHQQIVAAQQAAGLEDVWAIVLFGPNAAFPHGTGKPRDLTDGDLILIDTGGELRGYCSDVTRTFGFGRVSDGARRAFDAVLAAQRAALEQMRPGVACEHVDAAARKVIEQAGFGGGYQSFTHRLGHGIGLEGHEDPYLVAGNSLALQPFMTMSNEPGIYRKDELGVRIEDIVVITADGHRVLGPQVESFERPV